jgi:hypothetical protein
MLDPEQRKVLTFFVGAFNELSNLCTEHNLTEYQTNQISRVLRQFLFDEKNLIQAVARVAGPPQKIGNFRFECCPLQLLRDPTLIFASKNDGFHPFSDAPFKQNITSVTLGELGKQYVIEYMGVPFTVKDVVKYIANKEGGVHFDAQSLGVDEKQLKEIQNYMWVGGRAALTSCLRAIGLVVLDGLSPLAERAHDALSL